MTKNIKHYTENHRIIANILVVKRPDCHGEGCNQNGSKNHCSQSSPLLSCPHQMILYDKHIPKSCQQYWEKVHIKTCRLKCQEWEANCKCCWRKQSKEWSSITQHSGPLSNWWKFCQCQKCWWCREECHKPSSSQGRFCWAGWWWSGEGIRWWWWSRHRRTCRCESGDHHHWHDEESSLFSPL